MTIDEFSKSLIERAVAELDEGMKQARANVGASTCWDGYKAKGTKTKGGKEVPNCVKEEDIEEEKKKGLWDNIHAKRERGEAPAKKGEKGYPKTLNVEKWEGSEEDKGEDKKLAKKNKISLSAWEKSAADKKHDMKKEEVEKAEKEEKGEKKHKEGKAEEEKEMKKEAKDYLPGNQERLDANKNGKIDAHDFAILRNKRAKKSVKEMWQKAAEVAEGKKVEIEIMPNVDTPNDPEPPTGRKSTEDIKKKLKKEEVEALEEKKLSKAETAKKEKFVKGMKKKFGSFKSKYGERAKEVMYATATKMGKKAA